MRLVWSKSRCLLLPGKGLGTDNARVANERTEETKSFMFVGRGAMSFVVAAQPLSIYIDKFLSTIVNPSTA